MGILSTIFGSGEVIEKGFDLIDDFHTSDEEIIEAKVKGKIALLQGYAPFKVAQRYLAVMFTLNFLASFWIAVGLWAYGKDMQGFLGIMAAFNLGWIMLTIVGFYFGGGFLEGTINSAKKPK